MQAMTLVEKTHAHNYNTANHGGMPRNHRVVVFRTNWDAVTPEITKIAMTQHLLFDFSVVETWAELPPILVTCPELLIFHMDMAKDKSISTSEFVAMIRTMCKLVPLPKIKIAISVASCCSPGLIKEIKNTDIDGIVPSIASYGVDPCIDAISDLLNGKQHWPKQLIDELLHVKKPLKIVSRSIHLTRRQQQVMDLVCHRGLPNKTIANMLHITESTVKIHVSAILREYGVRNRTQLVLAARSLLHD